MFPVDKHWWTKKNWGKKCINSFLAHKLSHDRWLWFFLGHLRVPTRHCNLMVPVDWGWGCYNKMHLVNRACLTQEQQPPENFARVDYFLIQDSPGYQGIWHRNSNIEPHVAGLAVTQQFVFLHFRHLFLENSLMDVFDVPHLHPLSDWCSLHRSCLENVTRIHISKRRIILLRGWIISWNTTGGWGWPKE